MFGASLYIIVCSARNRLRVRLRRLREPRYLVGAIVGAAYLYFSFFARFRTTQASAARRQNRGAGAAPVFAALASAGPALGGLLLLATTGASWIMPFNSGLLDFSDAEIQILFPAPVSRRQLLIHRMVRSQLGLLFASVVAGIAMPSGSGFTRVRASVATWVLLVTAKIYFTGISLARTRLGSRDARSRRVAWLPLALLAAAIAIVARALTQAYAAHPPTGVIGALSLVDGVAHTGASRVVLWPFMAIARPLFAPWPGPYLAALARAAIILIAIVAWVLASDSTFQEAATEAAERRSKEPAGQMVTYRARSSGWTLSATGRPEGAFAWKAAMQTLRIVDKRTLARSGLILLLMTMGALSFGRANGVAATLGAFATACAFFSILLAPQIMRQDMRQDLRHLELLKTWPVKASAVVRGELVWPGALITVIAWTMTGVALLLSAAVFSTVDLDWRVAGGAAVAIVTPALVFAQLTIHNGVALIFPAWVPLGNQRPRGLDAMGQRLIMLGGTWLLLIVMMLPGALAGAIVWFGLGRFLGPAMLVPAAVICTVIVGVEVLLATEALGPAYERLDVMAVERVE
jgi:ABC-2 type transport system permease protein